MRRYSKQSGFTMVELLIYISVSVIILGAVATLYVSLVRARTKQQTISEVEAQGLQTMQIITQAIRNAQAITAPLPTASSTSLTLYTYTSTSTTATTTTIFDLASSTIRIAEGATTAIPLTSTQVVISGLTFRNLSVATAFRSIKIQFTVSHATTTGRYDSTYSETFYGAATQRKFQ